MNAFIHNHREKVMGILSGWDRIVFRGILCNLMFQSGRMLYLYSAKVLLKDFSGHVQKITSKVKEATLGIAKAEKRPILYLESSKICKEKIARRIAKEEGISEGLICTLTVVEPLYSYDIYKNQKTHKLELKKRYRK